MSDIVIKVNNLKKTYKLYNKPIDRVKEVLSPKKKVYHKEFPALNDVSFEVRRGEMLGIIGRNGSGKSTLLKLITGVISKSSGEIFVEGRVSALLELGAGFNPDMTGLENIFLNGSILGFSKDEIEKKLPDIIGFADIGEFINQPVKSYSSGMFVRLAFALSVNVEPDILIVDEALSVGDIFFQNKCFKKIDEIRKKGTTILLVTHDLTTVSLFCDRVIWLDKGKIREIGDVRKIISMYSNTQLEENNKMKQDLVDVLEADKMEVSVINEKKVFPLIKNTSQKADRMSEDSGVEIKSFFITNERGERVSDLIVEHKYAFHVIATFKKAIEDVIIGFVLENSKGVRLLGMSSYMFTEKSFSVVDNDIIECVFELTLPKITRGEYLISPAVSEGVQNCHTTKVWENNVASVQIINEGYNVSLIEIDADVKLNRYSDKDVIFK